MEADGGIALSPWYIDQLVGCSSSTRPILHHPDTRSSRRIQPCTRRHPEASPMRYGSTERSVLPAKAEQSSASRMRRRGIIGGAFRTRHATSVQRPAEVDVPAKLYFLTGEYSVANVTTALFLQSFKLALSPLYKYGWWMWKNKLSCTYPALPAQIHGAKHTRAAMSRLLSVNCSASMTHHSLVDSGLCEVRPCVCAIRSRLLESFISK
ncbi:hypothetical protein C8Q74DRAFT_856322 [Fomes fomentarius]|nr:hypothetical protein C8Q74DRAFT_856322 [Fomes fomentarius]